MSLNFILFWLNSGRELCKPKDNPDCDERECAVQSIEQPFPVLGLWVENLAGAGTAMHDDVETDGESGEDEDAKLLKGDPSHVDMYSSH